MPAAAAAAAAAAEGKARLRQRVAPLEQTCDVTAKHLVDVFKHLEAAAAEETAAGERRCIGLAIGSLKQAAAASSFAAADMLAARLAGLRGSSPDPSHPLSTVGVEDRQVRTALLALGGACEDSDEAFNLIKVCATHLETAHALLGYSGMAEIVDIEREMGIDALFRAKAMVERSSEKATIAGIALSATTAGA